MNTKLRRIAILCGVGGGLLLAVTVALGAASVQDLLGALKSPQEPARIKAIDALGAQHAAEAVGPLTELLKDPSAPVRAHAVQALGAIGAPAKAAVPALAEMLKDADDTVRRQVVKAVLRIRPGPKVTVPLCVKLLEDSDPGVKIRILHAIADARGEAVPGLIEALKHEKAAYWVCLILREIGPAAKAAVPALAEKLQDSRPEVRREAALALGAMQAAGAGAVAQLAATLGDEHVRVAATLALGQIGQIPAGSEAQIRANAQGNDRLLSTVSLWALTRVHPQDKELRRETTERLVARLKDKDAFVRLAAARALVALPPAPEITLPIWEKALQDADQTTAQYALDALASQGAGSVPRLVDLLKHEKLRGQVVYILGQVGPAAAPAAEALANLVNDKNERLASEAAVALAKIGPGAKSAVPTLAKALAERDSPVADAIAFALGKIGPEAASAEPGLRKTLHSRDASLSLVSAWALVHIRPQSADTAAIAIPVLTAGLRAPVAKFRQGAAEALGDLGPLAKDSAPALQKALDDKDRGVREEAAKALQKLKGPAAN